MAQEAWQLGSRYVLERRIGSGAMGQVWAGHDVDGNPRAFKLLRPEMADDPQVVARFLQERNLLTGLRSPYVIRVHDLVVEGPRLAIVMDYIAGPSLRGLLQQRGNLPPAEVADLGARIAEGLAIVHEAGILHRDLKPENVLLDDISGGFEPKLADFGIASLAVTATGHVGTANVIGTPQYLAPELGDGQPSGRASDLYALGVTLYEMAAGIVPFSSDSPLALLRLHADHAAGRPDGIPDSLWAVITDLLAKNPHERPASSAAVAERLRSILPGLRGVPAPAPLTTSPPTHPLTGQSPQSTAPVSDAPPQGPIAHNPAPAPEESASNQGASRMPDETTRHGLLLVGAIALALLVAGVVAWFFLGRDGSSGGSGHSSSSTSSQATPSPGPTSARLSSLTNSPGFVEGRANIFGQEISDALTIKQFPPGCSVDLTVPVNGRFDQLEMLTGYTTRSPTAPAVDITARRDGKADKPHRVSGADAEKIVLDVKGVRNLVLNFHQDSCSTPPRADLPFIIGGGRLTKG